MGRGFEARMHRVYDTRDYKGDRTDTVKFLRTLHETLEASLGEAFIGIDPFGSSMKGYFDPESSDWDVGVLLRANLLKDAGAFKNMLDMVRMRMAELVGAGEAQSPDTRAKAERIGKSRINSVRLKFGNRTVHFFFQYIDMDQLEKEVTESDMRETFSINPLIVVLFRKITGTKIYPERERLARVIAQLDLTKRRTWVEEIARDVSFHDWVLGARKRDRRVDSPLSFEGYVRKREFWDKRVRGIIDDAGKVVENKKEEKE